jgi:hypothetical protein
MPREAQSKVIAETVSVVSTFFARAPHERFQSSRL